MRIYYYTPIHSQMKSEGIQIGTPYIVADENTFLKNLAPIKKLKNVQHLDIFKDDYNKSLDGDKTLSENELNDGSTIYIGPGTYEKFYIQPEDTTASSFGPSNVSNFGPQVTVATPVPGNLDDDGLVRAELTEDFPQEAVRIDSGNSGFGDWAGTRYQRLTNPMKEGGKRKKRNSRKMSRKTLRKKSRKGRKSRRKNRSYK